AGTNGIVCKNKPPNWLCTASCNLFARHQTIVKKSDQIIVQGDIRELIVKLYGEANMSYEVIVAFGFLLLCLGIIRSLAIKYSPSDEKGDGDAINKS
ncbi:MAG: hypothetical protein WBN66_04915, partial [Smithella sp.]